jgi:RNA polymerase sigma-70 factor (ECF subfamily)
VERAKGGDAGAFGELYARHHDAIQRYVAFRVSDAPDAEDLTGQVFLRAWEALPGYEPRGYRFASWLYRIAHNLVADHHRRRATFAAAPLDAGAEVAETRQPTTLERVIAAEEAATLTRAVAQLPAEQRDVVLLRFVHGLSHGDIAQRLAKTQGASRVILHRALVTLNQILRSSLVAVLAVLLLVGGVVYAARTASPGEPLYVVRRVIEQVRQVLPPSAPQPPLTPTADAPAPSATPAATATPTPPRPSHTAQPTALSVAPAPPAATPSATPRTSNAPTAMPAPTTQSAGEPLPSATVGAALSSEAPTATAAPTEIATANGACCTATATPPATATTTPSRTPPPTASSTPSQTPPATATMAPSATVSSVPTCCAHSPTATQPAPSETPTATTAILCCEATPQATPGEQRLRLAIAVPSRPVINGGETFTVGVVLAHSRDLDGPTRVVLILPERLRYVEGSAERGGAYDAATRSVVWEFRRLADRPFGVLKVDLTADDVRRPMVVRLVAGARVGEESVDAAVSLALAPAPTPTP